MSLPLRKLIPRVLLVSLLASACGAEQPTISPTPSPADVPAKTTAPATQTAVQVSDTPAPVSLVEPSPTPTPTVVTPDSPTATTGFLSPIEPTPVPTPSLPEPTPTDVQAAVSEETQVFRIVPDQSTISYSIDQVLLNEGGRLETITGWTHEIDGQFQLNPANPVESRFSYFSVNVSTLNSDEPQRDGLLRHQALESGMYPMASFAVKEVRDFPLEPREGQAYQFQVSGNLTIRDTSQPAAWDVEAVLQGEQLTGKATTSFSLSDYGIIPPVLEGVREALDEVTVLVDFTFAKYEPPPSGST